MSEGLPLSLRIGRSGHVLVMNPDPSIARLTAGMEDQLERISVN